MILGDIVEFKGGINVLYGINELKYGHAYSRFYEDQFATAMIITIVLAVVIIASCLIITKKMQDKKKKAFINYIVIGFVVLFIINRLVSMFHIKSVISKDQENRDALIAEYGTTDSDIIAFNRTFINFKGDNVSDTLVRSLISYVNDENTNSTSSYYYNKDERFVINGIDSLDKVVSNKRYSIGNFRFNSRGVVIGCTIKEKN